MLGSFAILSASNMAAIRFLVGLIQRNVKGDPALPKRLTDKDIERGRDIHTQFIKQRIGLCFKVGVHADTDIRSRASHTIISFPAGSYIICYLHEENNT